MSENYFQILEVGKNVRKFIFSPCTKMTKWLDQRTKMSENEQRNCEMSDFSENVRNLNNFLYLKRWFRCKFSDFFTRVQFSGIFRPRNKKSRILKNSDIFERGSIFWHFHTHPFFNACIIVVRSGPSGFPWWWENASIFDNLEKRKILN